MGAKDLDDPLELAAQWCEDVKPLCEPPSDDGADALTPWLDGIGAGLRVRRGLDGLVPDDTVESVRRQVLARVTELQALVAQELGDLRPDTPRRRYVSARVKQRLLEMRSAVRDLQETHRANPLSLAMSIEGLRADVEWLGLIISRLDEEVPYPITAWMDVELERLRGSLCPPAERRADPRDVELAALCDKAQARVLTRRVERELGRAFESSEPESSWSQRFQLSRLQAQVVGLGETPDAHSPPPSATAEFQPAVESLRRRRSDLAARTDERILALPFVDRVEPCKRIVDSAIDEATETIAMVEGAPLARAVRRLALMRGDLEALAKSCDRWREKTVEDPGPEIDQAALALRWQRRRIGRIERRIRGEWQEKTLALRMENLLGRRGVATLENTVLVLIVLLMIEIAAETVLERGTASGLSERQHVWFAWLDLAICSVFLFEFALKLALAPDRFIYFVRHLAIDFVASLPFGFFSHLIDVSQMRTAAGAGAGGMAGPLERLVQFGRVARVLRLFRLAVPIIRLARIGLILLRLSDRLVRRMAGFLNRNIVLFEPKHVFKPESGDRYRLLAIRGELEQAKAAVLGRLDRAERRRLAMRILDDLNCRLDELPPPVTAEDTDQGAAREIPVEAVVERLIQMTPERLLARTGPAFVNSVDRYLRFLDKPIIRRFPGIRNLVAFREKGPAEAVALAANYLGHLIQRGLNVAYFFADLQGTLSPPVFLDRLGLTIVNATRTPAKRLLTLGSIFLALFLLVQIVPFPSTFRLAVDRVQDLLGWPVIIFGMVCLVFWQLGTWFRRIANRSADFSERVVEAQFAAHTKNLKTRRREQDAVFLAERVIDPELALRAADDHAIDTVHAPDDDDGHARAGQFLFENREHAFLRTVRLLYQDYLDGSPLHRSDTKASVQLLGNLALANLRRSHLGHFIRDARMLDRLDLSRSGGLFGGPYLWFNYITRMLVQDTAMLILDYNRNAIPVDRLACSPEGVRARFRSWVAARLRVEPDEVWVPESVVPLAGESSAPADGDCPSPPPSPSSQTRRKEAVAFLETVEFTAIDFLSDEPDRHAEINRRFGPQVAELVRRDREQNVRRAFQSFPLHELPLASRTVNPFDLYETYLARGRLVLLPFYLARLLARGVGLGVKSVVRVVGEILNPRFTRQGAVPSDTYWAALRKIHRMRKPVFMGSLWLRARFDVEYLGLALPSAPPGIAAQTVLETDLDYISATRQDRIIADEVRRRHARRLEWVARWLDQFGWTFDKLPSYLAREIPFLANRGGEALRGLVAACILDHDDIATLGLSIEGLKRVLDYAADPQQDITKLPPGLPDPVVDVRNLWHPVHHCRRPVSDLFDLPCFAPYDFTQQRRIRRYLRRHRQAVRGWIKVVLGQGASDPWATLRERMADVLLRTDLWSDQILVLRAVQTLTMLDLQHNCELVWNLGGYTRPEPVDAEPAATSRAAPGPNLAQAPSSIRV
jgi:hypothetical protein